jgi:hypothetical protein
MEKQIKNNSEKLMLKAIKELNCAIVLLKQKKEVEQDIERTWCIFIDNENDFLNYEYKISYLNGGYYNLNSLPKIGDKILLSYASTLCLEDDVDIKFVENDYEFKLHYVIVEDIIKHYVTQLFEGELGEYLTYRFLVRDLNITRKTLIEKA